MFENVGYGLMHIHPDNTAARAVDACGGVYTPEQIASGFAQGHKEALEDAARLVERVDALMAELFDIALTMRDYVSDMATGYLVGREGSEYKTLGAEDLARLDAVLARATST